MFGEINRSLLTALPEIDKAAFVVSGNGSNPLNGLLQAANGGSQQNRTAQDPHGLYGGPFSGPMNQVAQFTGLLKQGQIQFSPNGGLVEKIPEAEPDSNIIIPIQRRIKPCPWDPNFKLKKGQICFLFKQDAGSDWNSRTHRVPSTVQTAGNNVPVTMLDVVSLNRQLLKEQLDLFLTNRDAYNGLDPTMIFEKWSMEGIVDRPSHKTSGMDNFQDVVFGKKGRLETQNYWGGHYKTGDKLYFIIKKYDYFDNNRINELHITKDGIGLNQYSEDVYFKPFLIGAYTVPKGYSQVEPEAKMYQMENEHWRYDGIDICVGTVLAEPRFHQKYAPNYGKDCNGGYRLGYPLLNPREGMDNVVTELYLNFNSNNGANPF